MQAPEIDSEALDQGRQRADSAMMSGGIALSAMLHGAVIGYAALTLSSPSDPPESEPPIPVEIVMLDDPEQSKVPALELPEEARPPVPEAEPEAPEDLAEVAPPEELQEEDLVEEEPPPEPEERELTEEETPLEPEELELTDEEPPEVEAPEVTEPLPEEEPLESETPQLAEIDLAPETTPESVLEPLQPEQANPEASPPSLEAMEQPEPQIDEAPVVEERRLTESPPAELTPDVQPADSEPPADLEEAPLEMAEAVVEQAVPPRKAAPTPRVKPLPTAPVQTAEAAAALPPATESENQAPNQDAEGLAAPSEVAMVGNAEGDPSDQMIDELRRIVLLLQEQIGRCWQRRAGSHPVLQVDVSLNRNGTVREIDMSNWQELADDDHLRRTANEAFTAIRQCSPFSLPADKYALWRELRFRLHPSS